MPYFKKCRTEGILKHQGALDFYGNKLKNEVMKTTRLAFSVLLALLFYVTDVLAQHDSFADQINSVNKLHKSKDKVFDQIIYLDSASVKESAEFYLPKGKYVIYVVADTYSTKAISFSVKGNSMEWETVDKSLRKIVSEGKGLKQKKWIISNPILVSDEYKSLEFKVDDLMNMVEKSNARNQAQYDAQSRANALAMATGRTMTASASYSKYENGSELQINVTAESADVKHPWGAVRVLVFER